MIRILVQFNCIIRGTDMNNISFGKYKDGKEILWSVVRQKTDSIILFSKQGICVHVYHSMKKSRNCRWEESELCEWLHTEFIDKYFNQNEQHLIFDISIPSIDEITRWFPKREDRVCIASDEAMQNGAEIFCDDNNASVYWLRDTGRRKDLSATVVTASGIIYKSAYMPANNVCVRPIISVRRSDSYGT